MKMSKTNLGMIIPQRSAVNASKEDLAGIFTVQDIVPRRGLETNTDLTEDKTSDEVGELLVRLKSQSGRFFTLSLRQFFGLPVAATAMTNKEIEKEMTGNIPSEKMKPLYNQLLDVDSDSETLDLPPSIEFVYVEDRVTADGTKSVYPASAYPAFQERVAEMEAKNIKDIRKGNTEKKFTIMDVYQDINFIRSLENGEPRQDIPNLQAQKILVIKTL